ncbi:S41 family peptidase [Gemmatimonas aurantiaca]|uniref:S41 family peptidase n=1 Tax=Gemmatimonas aurantiaca TaxID=173480 RepID=UPI00301CF798
MPLCDTRFRSRSRGRLPGIVRLLAVSVPVALGLAGCQVLTPPPATQQAPLPVMETPVQPPRVPMPDAPADPEPDPAPSDSAGVARLVRLAQVWHLIALHHPAVAVRGAPLDSAFIRAVTLVRRAQDPALLQVAYARFLAVLDDPLTRVEATPETTPDARVVSAGSAAVGETAVGEIAVERTADSILVIQMPTATRYSSRAEVALREALASAPARVILDLRTSAAGTSAGGASTAGISTAMAALSADPDSLDAFVAKMELGERLASVPFSRSTVRVRRVGGARDVQGTWYYDDSWLGRDGVLVAARASTPRRVMVLANAHTVMPRAVLGLIATGRGTLIAEGALRDDALVPSVLVPVGSGLSVRIRTGEVVHVDGSSGVLADTTVAPAAAGTVTAMDSVPALRAALQFLRTGRGVRASRMPMVRAPAMLPGYYDTDPYPYMGARVLGAARIWSAMRARHAHRDLYDEDIDVAFERVIPKLEAARYAHEYAAALRDFVGVFDDAQVALTGASADSVRGLAAAPFRVRWVDGRAIISDIVRDSVTQSLGIEPGLEVVAADGYPMPAWISEHRGRVSAPNEWNRLYQLMQLLPYGPEGRMLLRVRDMTGRERQFDVPRRESYVPLLATVERPWQNTSRTLSSGIAYIDVNRLTEQTVGPELERHRDARAWILDLRGALPDTSAVFAQVLQAVRTRPVAVTARELHRYQSAPCLAVTLREATQQCADEREVRARISRGDTASHFSGRLVALLDERTSGAMERLAMALEASTDVTFVGSTTAGSPAETVRVPLPGQLSVGIPAAELRRADGAQWQRVGITPIVDARLTHRAFRSGADDVVERAQQWLVQQLDGTPRRRR